MKPEAKWRVKGAKGFTFEKSNKTCKRGNEQVLRFCIAATAADLAFALYAAGGLGLHWVVGFGLWTVADFDYFALSAFRDLRIFHFR